MKNKHFYKILMLLVVMVFSVSCSKDDEAPELTVSTKNLSFETEGGTSEEVTITTNRTWSASNAATSWLKLSKASGNNGTTTITLTATSNETVSTRSAVVSIESSNGQARRIAVTQTGSLYPSYNLSPKPADATGMSSTAVELAAKMGLGINIGNTMEALGGETAWGNPKITEEYIKFLKAKGFKNVRIPCSWVQGYLSDESKMKIDEQWLNRVHQVVKWCVENDMYVMLNIHWDGGWLEHNVIAAKKDITNAKQKALWEQIATKMRDFDEHLILAGANEPPSKDAQEMAILNSYHETFIKAVRATGGKNSYRTLVVQGPGTNAVRTYELMNLPYDAVPNRMMVEVHEYTPSQFAFVDKEVLGTWEVPVFYWGAGNHSTIEPNRNATYGEEATILESFKKLKEKFIDKGVPVVLGEYAAMRRDKSISPWIKFVPKDMDMHNKSVDYWNTFITKQCKINGVVPMYWEVGNVMDRNNNTVKDQAMVNALIAGFN
ncbi:cellulase family glycosylhydrolase [Flavobacterium piscis]|uniref:Aryl-phospho-beta-D-glucosidase BglC (GH1 family) n=1 Tax=Flavobacterium piscis TaxID=1114874 RepID=A0ABU1Y7R9_9FLAO|nr:cellulase family glycosylhydrolase [Flavobacterium piscis]MDR7210278.1 aryl-phospho-beta-D-glucosidase BglC (GH1 family) [Flavobacterium piscis]